LFGSGYVIEHCISVLRIKAKKRLASYYIADALKNINDILAERFGGNMMVNRLMDVMTDEKQESEKSGDEIAADIIRRAGLEMKGGSE
jgi:hypothetical protein